MQHYGFGPAFLHSSLKDFVYDCYAATRSLEHPASKGCRGDEGHRWRRRAFALVRTSPSIERLKCRCRTTCRTRLFTVLCCVVLLTNLPLERPSARVFLMSLRSRTSRAYADFFL